MMPFQPEYRRRRHVVEEALRNPELRGLSNNALHQTLGFSVVLIRWCRRRLEAGGVIPSVLIRTGKDGRVFDVADRVTDAIEAIQTGE